MNRLPELSDQARTWYILKGYDIQTGPSVLYQDHIIRVFRLNGVLHRTDGPAMEWSNGEVVYYLNERCYTEEEHRIAVNEMMKNGTT